MKRDWDKLRRQDKARARYSPISSFVPKKRKLPRFRGRRPKSSAPPQPKQPTIKQPNCVRTLRVEAPTFVAGAVFKRTNCKWRCTEAAPILNWMTRVRHIELIQQWLHKQHFTYQWLTTTPACEAHQEQAEEHPAEAHTPNKASQSSDVNTVPSKNNHTNEVTPGPTPDSTSLLEQNGLITPRCLIGPECSGQQQAESIASV